MLKSRSLIIFIYAIAINDSCIAVESTDSSLSLTWCRELADAYNGSAASAMIGLFWLKNGSRFMTNIQSMQFVINGLTPNTEYLLVFDVESYMSEVAKPSVRRLATRHIRTKYFSMLTKVIFLQLVFETIFFFIV